jgi:thiosulfate dehydrogenase
MHISIQTKFFAGLGAVALGSLLSFGTTQAREPFTQAELEKQQKALWTVAEEGYNLWHGSKPSMSSNGLSCGNCHPDGAAANPQTFPKFIPSFNRVVTFREMINWCIENPQVGKALDVSGKDMLAMEAYAFVLHRGKPIEPGLASAQTSPIKVDYGKGFPSKPSMIGKDTRE